MRSFDITMFAHHEQHPSWWRPRHPIVVCCHLPFLAVLGVIYNTTAMTTGHTLTFLVLGGLYLSSAAYHTWRPNQLLRVVDQTMISWFIVTVPLPWLSHEPWFQLLWLALLAATATNNWYHPTPRPGVEKLTFLALGALSAVLVLWVGLPLYGESAVGQTGVLVWFTITLYLGKLLVYHKQWSLVPRYIEAPELGHWLCGMATSLFAFVSAGVPA